MAPGLCPENEGMDPANAYQNANHAMQLAEDWLDVPMASSSRYVCRVLWVLGGACHLLLLFLLPNTLAALFAEVGMVIATGRFQLRYSER